MAIAKRIKRIFTRQDLGLRWDNLARLCVTLTLILIPILALPVTPDFWELHKSIALVGLMSLGWLFTFIGILRRGKTIWSWKPLDTVIGGVLGVGVLSLWFAADRWIGLTGISGSLSETLPVLFALASLVWLIRLHFHEQRLRLPLFLSLGIGVGSALLFQMFQLSGFLLFPNTFPSSKLFSLLSSSPVDVAIMAAAFGPAVLLFWSRAREYWQRLLILAAVTLSWLVVLFFQLPLAWAMFALGMIAVVFAQSRQGKRANVKIIGLAVGLAALGMVLQFSGIVNRMAVTAPDDVRLSQSASQAITKATVSHKPILGTGPNSWYQAYVHYRPISLNQTATWNNRFIEARSAWWQLTATFGTLGLATWAGLLLMAGWVFWKRWQDEEDLIGLYGAMIISITILTGFFATWSLVWQVILWSTFGVLYFGRSPQPKGRILGAGTWTTAALLVFILIAIWYPGSKWYASQIALDAAQKNISTETSLDQIQPMLERAVAWDERNLDAAELLARVYASQAVVAAQQAKNDQVVPLIQKSVQTLQAAAQLHPQDPAAYEALNNLFNALTVLVSDAEVAARENFYTLRQLEPASPIHDVGYGQTLLVSRTKLLQEEEQSQEILSQESQLLDQAIVSFKLALQKKPDYDLAAYGLAEAYNTAGESDQALTLLFTIPNSRRENSRFAVALGLTYAGLERLEEADDQFTQALAFDPYDTSAYLVIAGHYRDHAQPEKAKAILEQGIKNLPDDLQLQSALSELPA